MEVIMLLIKFCGKDKRESVKKAVSFYYDNFGDEITYELFFARCRLQDDRKTVHFYPGMEVDIQKHRELKKKSRKERKR
jgi:hypothetical protein